MLKELWLRAAAHGEMLAWGTVHLIAGAFILAYLAGVVAKGLRRMRIVRASREAERQLAALGIARTKALRDRVTSEKKRKEAA